MPRGAAVINARRAAAAARRAAVEARQAVEDPQPLRKRSPGPFYGAGVSDLRATRTADPENPEPRSS